ncbi:unnamed protein product, partial [Sphenostylis stenocarpa]
MHACLVAILIEKKQVALGYSWGGWPPRARRCAREDKLCTMHLTANGKCNLKLVPSVRNSNSTCVVDQGLRKLMKNDKTYLKQKYHLIRVSYKIDIK